VTTDRMSFLQGRSGAGPNILPAWARGRVSRLRRVLAAAAATDPDVPQLLTRPPGWVREPTSSSTNWC
jgi:hypothetical protein